MDLLVLELYQDDPSKCTARKMIKHELASPVGRKYRAHNGIIVLNPFAERVVSPNDRGSDGILVIDCSWKNARSVFFRKFGGKHRRLPVLLAANPTNYSRPNVLSSLEAVAAVLYITGEKEQAMKLLYLYKWGNTFYELNKEPLESYSNARDESEVLRMEKEYFPHLFS